MFLQASSEGTLKSLSRSRCIWNCSVHGSPDGLEPATEIKLPRDIVADGVALPPESAENETSTKTPLPTIRRRAKDFRLDHFHRFRLER